MTPRSNSLTVSTCSTAAFVSGGQSGGQAESKGVFTLGVTGGGKAQLALGGVDKGVAHPTVHAGGTCLGALQGTKEAVPAVLCV